MSIEEIKTKLGDKAEEILPLVQSAIDAVKEEEARIHAAAKSKVNKEAEGLRHRLKRVLDAIGYKDGDVETYIEQFVSKQEQTSTQKSDLEKRIDIIQKTLEMERKEKELLKQKSKNRIIESGLKEAFAKVRGKEYVIKSLIADGVVTTDENDNIQFSYDGEIVDFKTGVNKWLNDNKELVEGVSKGGDSSKPRGSSPDKTLTLAEFHALTPNDRMQKIKDGFTIT